MAHLVFFITILLFGLLCRSMIVYKDGLHNSFPNVKFEYLDQPLMVEDGSIHYLTFSLPLAGRREVLSIFIYVSHTDTNSRTNERGK